MGIKKTIFIAALFLASSASAMTGNELHTMCISKDPFYSSSCFTYIAGFSVGASAAQMASEIGNKNYKPPICLPAGYNNRQFVDVVKRSLKENPKTRHLPADELMLEAMLENFPCK